MRGPRPRRLDSLPFCSLLACRSHFAQPVALTADVPLPVEGQRHLSLWDMSGRLPGRGEGAVARAQR